MEIAAVGTVVARLPRRMADCGKHVLAIGIEVSLERELISADKMSAVTAALYR